MDHARTVRTFVNGEEHVQQLGEEHVVEGSVEERDYPAGTMVVRRRMPSATGSPDATQEGSSHG